jgi:hypothetical protein
MPARYDGVLHATTDAMIIHRKTNPGPYVRVERVEHAGTSLELRLYSGGGSRWSAVLRDGSRIVGHGAGSSPGAARAQALERAASALKP